MHENHYPYNLIRDIYGDEKNDCTHTDTTYIKGLYEQLKTLNQEEQACLTMYFETCMTLSAIGRHYGKTPQWARQFKNKAMRKLRHRSRAQHYEAIPVAKLLQAERQYQNVYRENNQLREALHALNADGIDPHAVILLANMLQDKHVTAPISELGLNTRAYNGLSRAGLLTIKDVIAVPEEKLIQTRSLGEKTVQEIKAKIREYILLPDSTREDEHEVRS